MAGTTTSSAEEVSSHGDGWLEDQGGLPLCMWTDEIYKTGSDGMSEHRFSVYCSCY